MLKMKTGFIRRNKSVKIVLAAMLAACVLCGCGEKNVETVPQQEETQTVVQTTEAATQPTAPAFEVGSVEAQGDYMVVTTSFAQVKYPFAFADLIRVTAVEEGETASLEFVALIANEEHPLFAIRFGAGEGITLGTLAVPNEAEPRAVIAEFYPADEALLGDHMGTFLAAQETFNDVMVSLAENQNFVAGE